MGVKTSEHHPRLVFPSIIGFPTQNNKKVLSFAVSSDFYTN